MIERTFDAARVNAILHHPAVFAAVRTPWWDSWDMTPIVADPANVMLEDDGALFAYFSRDRQTYSVHTLVLPEARLRAFWTAKASVAWMRDHTDACRIVTTIPVDNWRAERLARAVGFQFFERQEAFHPSPFGLMAVQRLELKLRSVH